MVITSLTVCKRQKLKLNTGKSKVIVVERKESEVGDCNAIKNQ